MQNNAQTEITSKGDEKGIRGGALRGIMYELLVLLIKIAAIIGVFVAIFTFIFGIFRTGDASMHPAIKDGDLVIYYRYDKEYVASDSVVVKFNDELQARRVIAVAGDTVDLWDGNLVVNGSTQQEREIHEKTYRLETEVEFPLVVPDNEVFVLGDGREHASDSRVYGTVPIKDTLGKVTIVIRTRRP